MQSPPTSSGIIRLIYDWYDKGHFLVRVELDGAVIHHASLSDSTEGILKHLTVTKIVNAPCDLQQASGGTKASIHTGVRRTREAFSPPGTKLGWDLILHRDGCSYELSDCCEISATSRFKRLAAMSLDPLWLHVLQYFQNLPAPSDVR